jgi:hypothetical protein
VPKDGDLLCLSSSGNTTESCNARFGELRVQARQESWGSSPAWPLEVSPWVHALPLREWDEQAQRWFRRAPSVQPLSEDWTLAGEPAELSRPRVYDLVLRRLGARLGPAIPDPPFRWASKDEESSTCSGSDAIPRRQRQTVRLPPRCASSYRARRRYGGFRPGSRPHSVGHVRLGHDSIREVLAFPEDRLGSPSAMIVRGFPRPCLSISLRSGHVRDGAAQVGERGWGRLEASSLADWRPGEGRTILLRMGRPPPPPPPDPNPKEPSVRPRIPSQQTGSECHEVGSSVSDRCAR